MPLAPSEGDARPLAHHGAARPRQKSPNKILAEAEEQWMFSEEELLRTPSIVDGMSVEQERETRAKGLNFIRQVGIMLKLPELTLSTAAIFFNRYLMRMSLKDRPGQKALHHYALAGTCLFLATKVEESCRKLRDFIEACCRVAQKKPDKRFDEQSKDYWKWRDTILQHEDVLLETLCFDLTIDAPHKQLFEMLKALDVAQNKPLRNAAWAFVTDSNMTTMCLISRSRVIAASALYAGARLCDVKLKDINGHPWWEELGITVRDMVKATNFMAQNYENPPQKTDSAGSGGDAGSGSIYVGLFTDPANVLQDDSSQASMHTASDGSAWEKTRLKAAQGTASPAALGGHDGEESAAHGLSGRGNGSPRSSVASHSSVKRSSQDAQLNGSREQTIKRQKLSAGGADDTGDRLAPPSKDAAAKHGSDASQRTTNDAQNGCAAGHNEADGGGSEEGEI